MLKKYNITTTCKVWRYFLRLEFVSGIVNAIYLSTARTIIGFVSRIITAFKKTIKATIYGIAMKEMQLSNNVKTKTETSANAEISRVAVTAISVSAALIGIWAVACMVAGISNSSGPINLVSSLFKAIIG